MFAGILLVAVGVTGFLIGDQTSGAPEGNDDRALRPTVDRADRTPESSPPKTDPDLPPPKAPELAPKKPRAVPRRRSTPAEIEAQMRAAARQYVNALKIPESVMDEAGELDVSAEVLRDTYAAIWWLHARGQYAGPVQEAGVRDALATLAAKGETGFLAIVSLLRGGVGGPAYAELVHAMWKPGYEQHLIESVPILRENGSTAHYVYRSLAVIDTDGSRRYLRERLTKRRHHATEFTVIAEALGKHKDASLADQVAAGLKRSAWTSFHPRLLGALGDMGGDGAKRELLAYLDKPGTGYQSFAIRALAGIDRNEARTRGQALLAGDKIGKLERHRLRGVLDAMR